MSRPELGPLTVGQKVLVIEADHYRRKSEPVPATVTKVARVWVTLTEITARPHPREWRMRIDVQRENHRDYSQLDARFVTPEQWAYEHRETEARAFLKEERITIEYGSPWRDRAVELADLIRGTR